MFRPEQNYVLAGLPVHVRARLFPCLELVSLPSGCSLHEPGDILRYIYFPVDCIVSLSYVAGIGVSGEIAQVGKEGVVDASVFLGAEEASNLATVQTTGYLYRLPAQVFRDEFDRHAELLKKALRHTQFLINQVAQTALCNRYHTVSQQLCRWLLSVTDRTGIPEMYVTQGQIANLLGVRREGITAAAGKLQKLGVIEYGRGRVKILDRSGLEKHACGCYRMLKKESEWLRIAAQS